MKKILANRLNELKSKRVELKQPKLSKIMDYERLSELNIRMDEIIKLIQILNTKQT